MKKKLLSILLTLFLVPCALLFTGCGRINYTAVIPTERPYTIEMTRHVKAWKDDGSVDYEYTVNYTVKRSSKVFDGDTEASEYIYVEYSRDYDDDSLDEEETLIYVKSKSFYLDGTTWKKDVSTLWTRWSMVYGQMGKGGTFVDWMTGEINGRDFYNKYKTGETSEYIEYTFNHDNEKFRISNNAYHLLLHYNLEYSKLIIQHNATMTLANPTVNIPYESTLTAELLAS